MGDMADQATIAVSLGLRDRIRDMKGVERTYEEVLSSWADRAENERWH